MDTLSGIVRLLQQQIVKNRSIFANRPVLCFTRLIVGKAEDVVVGPIKMCLTLT